ncbi:MAG: metallophosphoesterase family protein [Victivallales bacterium]|nr:metallophosphoesterase family protein [Victivallales bacterium]
MKYAILGDIHGNLEAMEAVLAACRELGVDKYACIGDVVGYNANPKECLDLLRGLGDNLVGVVKGNHDEYVSNGKETLGFNPLAATAVEWTRRKLGPSDLQWLHELPYMLHCAVPGFGRFQLVHGTLDNPSGWGYIFDRFSAETSFQYQTFSLCFIGHTHVPLAFEKNDMTITGGFYESVQFGQNRKYLINVGSVGQPRDGDWRAAFAVFSPKEALVQLYRVEYDIATTQQKIIDAGLPQRLADRLAVGR